MSNLLSLCMIVRDEEKVLRRCLESVKNFVDEIIIVDTGSIDATKQIACEYTEKIYDFEWINDFAAAKNAAIQRASSKWILVLDADEYVDSTQMDRLLNMLKEADHTKPLGYILTIFNYTGSIREGKMVESTALRLFSNHPDLSFERAIHEQVAYRYGEFEQIYYRLSIFHTGYTLETRQEKDKSGRNLAIFEKLKETRQFEEYDFFTLGNEYFAIGDLKKALYYYKRASTKKVENQAFMLHCSNRTVITLIELDRLKEALEVVEDGLKRFPAYADYYCYKGLILEKIGLTSLSTQWFETCLKISNSPQGKDGRYWLISPNYGSIIPLTHLTNSYLASSDIPQTVGALTKLVSLSPGDQMALYQLLNLLSQHEDTNSIIQFMEKIYTPLQPIDVLQLFQVSLLLGNNSLINYYQQQCKQHDIVLSLQYKLLLALIMNRQSEFDDILSGMQPSDHSEHNNKVIILASIVWKQRAYTSLLCETDQSNSLKKGDFIRFIDIALSEEDSNYPEQLDAAQLNFIVTLLIDLFKFGYFDAYDEFLQKLQPFYFLLANLLGDYFFAQNQVQLAIDYYSLLIQKEQLGALGYENIGKLYVSQGDLEEGLSFITKSLKINPRRPSLYIHFFEFCKHKDMTNELLNMYREQYPHYYSILLNNLKNS
ncbi:glycosyltransferase [Paenibacillus alba]|uniref:Glycosyltransferase n=1 Tax=Paenibacillus alba TaxID=1197127 RepID=A0ABU6G152_9BACL|nr:glycosyltransferase [Paenibacillus alba]MEC0227898.1 glycosyltransferase [Paenibacillus alba]